LDSHSCWEYTESVNATHHDIDILPLAGLFKSNP
jgi:hypothetical protein